MVMLQKLISAPDIEDGAVTLDQWLRFLDDVRVARGSIALDTFINYLGRSCETNLLRRMASSSPPSSSPPRVVSPIDDYRQSSPVFVDVEVAFDEQPAHYYEPERATRDGSEPNRTNTGDTLQMATRTSLQRS